jgi:hypothetical protein
MVDSEPPVIVDTGSELLLFTTIAKAEGYLEPIDVENDEYPAAYDSQGRLLELRIERIPRTYFFGLMRSTAEYVRIQPALSGGDHSPELTARLRTCLGALGATNLTEGNALDRLLEQLRERVGFVC